MTTKHKWIVRTFRKDGRDAAMGGNLTRRWAWTARLAAWRIATFGGVVDDNQWPDGLFDVSYTVLAAREVDHVQVFEERDEE